MINWDDVSIDGYDRETTKKAAVIILNNLNLIRENKEKILNCEDEGFTIEGLYNHTKSDYFSLACGVCFNAAIFAADYFNNNRARVLENNIGYLFTTHRNKGRNWVFPIDGDADYRPYTWRNPVRWMYVDYCIYQMQCIIDHGVFDKDYYNG